MIGYLFYRFFYFLSLWLPLNACFAIATFLSLIKYYFSPRDRRAVIANLKYILPESEQKRIYSYAIEVFINFGKYLVEFFRLHLLKKEDLDRKVKIPGREYVDQALSNGKGAIILSAHMGNWELGGVFMALLGYPMISVALPHRHSKVNSFFNFQREKRGAVVVPSLGVSVRRIYEALKNNKLVALVADRDFASGGRKMPFLGLEKTIPRGPAALSMRTGAPIIPCFVIRQPDNSHILEFLKPINSNASEEDIIAEYTKVIEAKIRQYPSQWLMFREFWKE
jgi:KDO2-lipid IV(A) lauroyltransferase